MSEKPASAMETAARALVIQWGKSRAMTFCAFPSDERRIKCKPSMYSMYPATYNRLYNLVKALAATIEGDPNAGAK